MSPFKVNFNIEDYKDILPAIPEDDAEIMNIQYDDIYQQYWRRMDFPMIITQDFIEKEAYRVKNGVWMLNKGVLLWIPPNYYQFLQYGMAGGDNPQFRLKRLKAVYNKIRVRKNPRFIGTYVIKNRQDGETTTCMSDSLWEVISGELNNGLIGIQSKTRDDAINPCWFSLTSQWRGYPQFFKQAMYPHFTSGDNIAEKLRFSQNADPANPNDKGKNVEIFYGPSVFNAFDGKNNMRRVILDEINKWINCSFSDCYANYRKFIMPGKVRKGLFDIISSPADKNGKWNDEAYQFWQDSDPDKIQSTGSTKSRCLRYYSNPLEGIEGFYDEFGDADPQEILEHIMRERAIVSKDKLMSEVRGYPLPKKGTMEPDEEQLFGSTDSSAIWINLEGIKAQRIEVLSQKEARVQYGLLEWPNNIVDSGIPVFRTSDKMHFDEEDARFCLTETMLPKMELSDIHEPPSYIEECLGIDPFNLRYKRNNKVVGSLGAGISWKFRDVLQDGRKNYPTAGYLSRPSHQEVFFEDMIKLCVYRRAMAQYENSNDKLENYFDDRGFSSWLIPSINAKPIEVNGEFKIRRGDAPSGKGATAFMNEGIGLINGVTNKPILPTDPYFLKWFNIEEALEDLINFNKDNTQEHHWTMCLIQCTLGAAKLMFQKKRKKSSINNQILDEFFG